MAVILLMTRLTNGVLDTLHGSIRGTACDDEADILMVSFTVNAYHYSRAQTVARSAISPVHAAIRGKRLPDPSTSGLTRNHLFPIAEHHSTYASPLVRPRPTIGRLQRGPSLDDHRPLPLSSCVASPHGDDTVTDKQFSCPRLTLALTLAH
jgi:hypothetical protein